MYIHRDKSKVLDVNRYYSYSTIYSYRYLQSVGKKLVHLRNLGGNGKVDGAVANLNNEATLDLRVDLQTSYQYSVPQKGLHNSPTYLWHNLQLLALSDVLALADSVLQLLHDLVVKRRSRGDHKLDLASLSAHEHTKLLRDTLKYAKTVVLGQGLEEVCEGVGLVGNTSALLQLSDDLLLVRDRECRRGQDGLELGVALEGGVQVVHGFGNGVDRGLLGSGRVLCLLSDPFLMPINSTFSL